MKYIGDLLLAAIPAALTGGAAIVVFVMQARRSRQDLERRVGEPNGRGNVVQMLEHLLMHQGRLYDRLSLAVTRLDEIEMWQQKQDERIKAVEQGGVA